MEEWFKTRYMDGQVQANVMGMGSVLPQSFKMGVALGLDCDMWHIVLIMYVLIYRI